MIYLKSDREVIIEALKNYRKSLLDNAEPYPFIQQVDKMIKEYSK